MSSHKKYFLIVPLFLAGVLIFYFYPHPAARPLSPIAVQKASILAKVSAAAQTPLTEAEKKALYAEIQGNKIQSFGFSGAEQLQLLNALNK